MARKTYWAVMPDLSIRETPLALRQCEIGAIGGFAERDDAEACVRFLRFKREQQRQCKAAGCSVRGGFCRANRHFPPLDSELLRRWNTTGFSGSLEEKWASMRG